MATNRKQTSPRIAKKASQIMRDGRTEQELEVGRRQCAGTDGEVGQEEVARWGPATGRAPLRDEGRSSCARMPTNKPNSCALR